MTAAGVEGRRATGPDRLPVGFVVAAIAVAAVVTAATVASIPLRDQFWFIEVDFKVYHLAGEAVRNGISPFDVATDDNFLYIYPPIAALLFVPLGLLDVHVAFALWTFANVVALVAATWLALGLVEPAERTRRAWFALLVAVVALPTTPVSMNLAAGQINVLLMLLVVVDLARRPGRFQGVALGIAAGIKLTPLIFIAYLLLTRRFRAAAVSLASFAGTVVVAFLVLPGSSVRWWTDLILETDRMKPPGSGPFIQSMGGVLGEMPGVLHEPWLWLLLAGAVGLGGLLLSAWYGRRGMEAVGVFACAVTGLLVSPISWPQHWIWLIPGLAVWLWWARSKRKGWHRAGVWLVWLVSTASAVLIFSLVGVVVVFPTAGIVAISSLPVLGGLAFLVVLAVARSRLEHRPTPPAELPDEVAGPRRGLPAGRRPAPPG